MTGAFTRPSEDSILATLNVGCAPLEIQYLTLSTSNTNLSA